MARQPSFDRSDVATAGLAVVAELGWTAVTMRAVAEQLAVSPMALYRVAHDAEALRCIVADAAAEPIQPDPAIGDLIAALADWARRVYTALEPFPGLAGFVIVEWTELPRWLDIVETLLARAAANGRAGAPAVATVNAVYAYVLIRCQLRDAARMSPRRKLAPVRRARTRYPHITANLDEFAVARTDRHFGVGLDALLRGLQAPRT